jgi:asparagine synthase (glutamine-hydrolysing)
MAHAVEGRFPFLDHRVVELGAELAPAMKLRGLREKYVLRRQLGRHLPRAIVERPKQPYRAPDSESFLGAGAPAYVQALLSPDAIVRAGYFEPRAVRKLVEKCRNPLGPVSAGDNMAFIGILSTQLLHSCYVKSLI